MDMQESPCTDIDASLGRDAGRMIGNKVGSGTGMVGYNLSVSRGSRCRTGSAGSRDQIHIYHGYDCVCVLVFVFVFSVQYIV